MIRDRKKAGEYTRTVSRYGDRIVLSYRDTIVPSRIQAFLKQKVPYTLPMEVVDKNTIAFKWLPHKNLYDLHKTLSREEKSTIVRQLVGFVVAMNKTGWAHRDLHQKNILWDGEQITIVDWEYVHENPVPLRYCYDLTGEGLPSPLRSNNMHVFNKKIKSSLIHLFPNLTLEDFFEEETRQMQDTPKLSVAVMAHPSREQWFHYLREKLGPDAKFIIDHDSEGVWPNARKAWAAYDPDADYHLVIQDDAIVCENFYEKVGELLKKGHKAYCLYWGNHPRTQKSLADIGIKKGYVIRNTPLWGVAVIISTDIIDSMLQWTGNYPWPSTWGTLADDTRICKYLKKERYDIYYPLPSLVDHRVEDNETLTDRDKPARYALYFADTYTPNVRESKKEVYSVKEIANKYTKNTAKDYEKTRKDNEIWKKEDALMVKLLTKHEPLRLLDVPVGTGRFLPLYEDLGIDVIGADISSDMLDEARKKEASGELLLANVSKLPFTDNMFDTTVCMRFFTWTNVKELNEIAAELRRVSTDRVIASAWISSISTRRGETGPIVHSYDNWKTAWNNCKMTAYPIHPTRKGNYTVYDIDLKG